MIFLILFSSVLTLIHVFIKISLTNIFTLSPQANMALTIFLCIMLAISVSGFILMRTLPTDIALIFSWIFYTWLGVMFLLIASLAIADIFVFAIELSKQGGGLSPDRREALKNLVGFTALASTAFLSGVAVVNTISPVSVKNVTIKLKKLPKKFEDFKIVQLSDLHIGINKSRSWLQDVIEHTNKLKPDMIVITGDLVDGTLSELKDEVAEVAKLKSHYGTYFVTGNHDYYSGADAWCNYLSTLGVKPLRNQRISIEREGEHIDIAGIEDHNASFMQNGGPDFNKALKDRDEKHPVILLAHQPIDVFEAAKYGVDLQLSGHTHGGQIWPFHYIVRMQQHYLAGLYRHQNTDTQIYVSRGTGNWGPSMRLNAPAEITLITLKKA